MKCEFHQLRSHFVQLIMCKTLRKEKKNMIHDTTISWRGFTSSNQQTPLALNWQPRKNQKVLGDGTRLFTLNSVGENFHQEHVQTF